MNKTIKISVDLCLCKTVRWEEKRKKEADKAFLEDFISKDLEKRRPHLERITREILDARVTEDMLSEEYLENHTEEVLRLCNRMTYFQNVLTDPINEPFFNNLPPLERELLQKKYSDIGGSSAGLLVNRFAMKGISLKDGELYKDVTYKKKRKLAPQVVSARQMDGPLVEVFRQDQQELKKREEEVYRKYGRS